MKNGYKQSYNVNMVDNDKRFNEAIKRATENQMRIKEKGHSMFLNLYGIYSYFREIKANPLTPEEIIEVKDLLNLEIDLADSKSFTDGQKKGLRLYKVEALEREIPEIETKINNYLNIYKSRNIKK